MVLIYFTNGTVTKSYLCSLLIDWLFKSYDSNYRDHWQCILYRGCDLMWGKTNPDCHSYHRLFLCRENEEFPKDLGIFRKKNMPKNYWGVCLKNALFCRLNYRGNTSRQFLKKYFIAYEGSIRIWWLKQHGVQHRPLSIFVRQVLFSFFSPETFAVSDSGTINTVFYK